MNSRQIRALALLADRRYQSFSETAEATLFALEQAVPGTIMLGQVDPEEGLCRVMDLRGQAVDGLERGSTIPMIVPSHSEDGEGVQAHPTCTGDGSFKSAFLRSLPIETCLAAPLEMSDGSIVGVLCALADHGYVHDAGHDALLGIAARLLSYEWERVQTGNQLRRLEARLGHDGTKDPDTGLASREAFVAAVDREWRLAKRGNVKSVLLACRVESEAPSGDFNEAMPLLAMKDAAAVLAGNARSTDHVGRVGEASLAAVLVGCQSVGNAHAFIARFHSALERTTRARPFPIAVSFGLQDMAESSSAAEALERAENAAGERSERNPDPVKARGGRGR